MMIGRTGPINPVSTGIDLAIVFLVVVCVLAALYLLDWMRN